MQLRVISAVLSAGVLAAGLAGCGGGGDKAAITKVIQTYDSAFASGNGTRVCSQLTGSAARSMVSAIRKEIPDFSSDSCAAAVRTVAGNLGGDERARLRDAKITSVHVAGQRATAKLSGSSSPTRLIKTGGHWYITGGL